MPSKPKNKNTRRKSRANLEVRARSARNRQQRLGALKKIGLPAVAIIALAILLLSGVGLLARTILSSNDHYIIRNILVESDGRMTPAMAEQFGEIERGANIFAININEVRERLENIPLVREVEVRRTLPDTLNIRISERVALAYIESPDGHYRMAVDRDGIVIGPARTDRGLPTLTGIRLSQIEFGRTLDSNLLLHALKVLDLCDRTRLKQFIDIDYIDIGDTEVMEIGLRTGEYVTMPRRDIRSKLIDLANILQTCRLEQRTLARIDLTTENVAPGIEYR